MTATTGFTGIGATLKMGDGASPETFTSIGNLTDFGMDINAGEVDATHLLSSSGFREFKQGFKDVTVPFSGHFDPDNPTHDDSTGLLARIASGASGNFKADFSGADNGGSGKPTSNAIASFQGVLLSLNVAVAEGMVTVQGSIRVSSQPAWDAT